MRSELEFSNTTAVVMLEVGVLRSDGLLFVNFLSSNFQKKFLEMMLEEKVVFVFEVSQIVCRPQGESAGRCLAGRTNQEEEIPPDCPCHSLL